MRYIILLMLTILLFSLSSQQAQVLADGDPVFVGAGDIASCGTPGAAKTAALLDKIPGLVFGAGDNVYSDGTLEEYKDCYEPTWGRFKNRLRVIPGDHDYHVKQGAAYYQYFGTSAGPAGKGYYSFDLGAWHIVMLNSNAIQSLQAQESTWLKADLSLHPALCTLAIVHHPVFSSSAGGVTYRSRAFFQVLYDAGADVIISGDAHQYERFAPQNLRGQKEPARGIRQFVVGTGGATLNNFGQIWRTTEARDNTTWGVLKLTLHAASYEWEFIPVEGGKYHDSGSAACVSAPVPEASATKPANKP
jgi:hypothetical protein